MKNSWPLSLFLAALMSCASGALSAKGPELRPATEAGAAIEWRKCGSNQDGYCAEGATLGRNALIAYIPARRRLLFVGPMGRDFDRYVAAAVARFPSASVFVINSGGGMARPAFRAADVINNHAIPVRVQGSCASACVLFWAAIGSREIATGSRLGLHSNRLGGLLPGVIEDVFVARNNRKAVDVLRAAGFPDDLIAKGIATPSSQVLWIDAGTLKRAGVVFTLVDK